MQVIRVVDKIITKFCSIMLVVLCTVIITSAFMQVLSRTVINNPFAWTEELCRYTMVWLVFISGGIGIRNQNHIAVNVVRDMFPVKIRSIIFKIVNVLIFIFAGVIIFWGTKYAIQNFKQVSPALKLPVGAINLCLPLGGIFMCFYAFLNVCGLRDSL